jgi:hypothetical protein
MAIESITLGTLTNRISFLLTNSASPDTDRVPEYRWAVHTALRELVSRAELTAFRVDSSFATANGTADYYLADDFCRMLEPGVYFAAADYRTLYEMTEMEFRSYELERTQQTGDPRNYLLRERNASTGLMQVRLWPTPTSVRTIKYHYLTYPAKVYDGNDATIIDKRLPAEYHHHLLDGAMYYFTREMNTVSEYEVFARRWEQCIAEAKAKNTPTISRAQSRVPYQGPVGAMRGKVSRYQSITPPV